MKFGPSWTMDLRQVHLLLARKAKRPQLGVSSRVEILERILAGSTPLIFLNQLTPCEGFKSLRKVIPILSPPTSEPRPPQLPPTPIKSGFKATWSERMLLSPEDTNNVTQYARSNEPRTMAQYIGYFWGKVVCLASPKRKLTCQRWICVSDIFRTAPP